MEKSKEIPVLYLFLYREIKEKSIGGIYIDHSILLEILKRRLWKVPKFIHYEIVRELKEFNLIKRYNTKKYEVIGKNADNLLNFLKPI